jgi:hypothetical protein
MNGSNWTPKTLTTACVRAILAGRKTQLRQALDPQPPEGAMVAGVDLEGRLTWTEGGRTVRGEPCPLGEPGDRLWVREPWALPTGMGGALDPEQAKRYLRYLADEELGADGPERRPVLAGEFHPAREMPGWASRLILEITGIRLEQVQAISPEDLAAEGGMWREGAPVPGPEADREGFARWWSAANAARGTTWDRNPWVWVIEFRRVVADESKPAGNTR